MSRPSYDKGTEKIFICYLYSHTVWSLTTLHFRWLRTVSRIPKLLPKGFYALHLVKRHQRWRKWVNCKRPENRLCVIDKAFHQPLKIDRKTKALAHISGIGYRAFIFLDVRNICWSREFPANDNTTAIDEGLPNSHNSSSCVVKRQGNIETIISAEPTNPGHCCCHIYKTATGIENSEAALSEMRICNSFTAEFAVMQGLFLCNSHYFNFSFCITVVLHVYET